MCCVVICCIQAIHCKYSLILQLHSPSLFWTRQRCHFIFLHIENSIVENFGVYGTVRISSRVYPVIEIHDKAQIFVFNNGTKTTTNKTWITNTTKTNLEKKSKEERDSCFTSAFEEELKRM